MSCLFVLFITGFAFSVVVFFFLHICTEFVHCYEHTLSASADVEFDDVGGDVRKVIEVEPAMEQIMLQLVFLRVECF